MNFICSTKFKSENIHLGTANLYNLSSEWLLFISRRYENQVRSEVVLSNMSRWTFNMPNLLCSSITFILISGMVLTPLSTLFQVKKKVNKSYLSMLVCCMMNRLFWSTFFTLKFPKRKWGCKQYANHSYYLKYNISLKILLQGCLIGLPAK